MQAAPEAFLLLSLPSCTLAIRDFSETGPLGLQCVTVPLPDASSAHDRDVYLVLKLNMSETPIDPARVIQRTDTPVARVYTFYNTPTDPAELVLTVPCPPGDTKSTHLHEDLDTFEGILEQYVVDFRTPASATSQAQAPAVPEHPPPTYVNDQKDLRGHLVMINEETGEVIGEVEDRFRIQEDPVLYERGHENDPVVIEVPDEAGLREGDANALAAFARVVPPDQQDWITKSATIVSHAISLTTSLLVTTISTASNYYIAKSNPSPHHSSANLTASNAGKEKGTLFTPRSHSPTPPPLPPRALVFLTSDRTRKNLRSVHSVSGQAVKVSAKTVRTIDNMIRRAMGARPKQNRLGYIPAQPNSLSPVPYASPSPHTAYSAPYTTYTPASGSSTLLPQQWNPDSKPPLPPRYSSNSAQGSPQPPPLPARTMSYQTPPLSQSPFQQYQQQNFAANPPLQPKLSTTRRVLISADLILSTIDDSTRKLLDTGTNNIGRVVHHKYGSEAAESSMLMAGTARNAGLVYIDMSGIGRRALLRRAGMSFVKGRVQSKDDGRRPVPPVPGQEAQR